MKVHRASLLIAPLLLVSLGYYLSTSTSFLVLSQPGCHTPTTSQREAWNKGATVKYHIDPSLPAEKKAAIEEVLNSWNNANGSSGNNSDVTFEISSAPVTGTNSLNIKGWNTGTGIYAITSKSPGAASLDRATIGTP